MWALGCVLYEMFTGRRAFPGYDVAEVLASYQVRARLGRASVGCVAGLARLSASLAGQDAEEPAARGRRSAAGDRGRLRPPVGGRGWCRRSCALRKELAAVVAVD